MTKKDFPAKFQVEDLKPHLHNYLHDKILQARKEIIESSEFEQVKDEYLTTEEYTKLMNSLPEDLTIKTVNVISNIVDTFYDENSNLDSFLKDQIENISPSVFWKYGFALNGKQHSILEKEVTLDNYKEQLLDVIEEIIDSNIEEKQKKYAIKKLDLIPAWFSLGSKVCDKLNCVISSTTCGNHTEFEKAVDNAFDYKKLATGNDTII